jgi:hypothetical protein
MPLWSKGIILSIIDGDSYIFRIINGLDISFVPYKFYVRFSNGAGVLQIAKSFTYDAVSIYDFVFFDLIEKRTIAYIEHLGCFATVPVGFV